MCCINLQAIVKIHNIKNNYFLFLQKLNPYSTGYNWSNWWRNLWNRTEFYPAAEPKRSDRFSANQRSDRFQRHHQLLHLGLREFRVFSNFVRQLFQLIIDFNLIYLQTTNIVWKKLFVHRCLSFCPERKSGPLFSEMQFHGLREGVGPWSGVARTKVQGVTSMVWRGNQVHRLLGYVHDPGDQV